MRKILFVFVSLCLTQEMEVDGNLKVTGTIQNDSLAQVINLQQQEISSLLVLIAQLQAQIALLESQMAFLGQDLNNADCAGVVGGSAVIDECGICDNDLSNDCLQDCNGEWGGTAVEDVCGECGGDITDEVDCPNYALSFDGDGDYIDFSSGIIPSEGLFTVECWVYGIESGKDFMEILAQGSPENAFFIGHEKETGYIRAGDGWNPSIPFPFYSWNHIAISKSANNTYLFINGNLVAQLNNAIPNPAQDNFFIIGEQYNRSFNEAWYGYIDEIRISNSSRYTDDFTPQDKYVVDGNTIALWHFNEGSGGILNDSSPNGFHGIIHGNPEWIER